MRVKAKAAGAGVDDVDGAVLFILLAYAYAGGQIIDVSVVALAASSRSPKRLPLSLALSNPKEWIVRHDVICLAFLHAGPLCLYYGAFPGVASSTSFYLCFLCPSRFYRMLLAMRVFISEQRSGLDQIVLRRGQSAAWLLILDGHVELCLYKHHGLSINSYLIHNGFPDVTQ